MSKVKQRAFDEDPVSALTREVAGHYERSTDANGYPVRKLLEHGANLSEVHALVDKAVKTEQLHVVFAEIDTNPHINRLPQILRLPYEKAIEKCNLAEACLYPSPQTIIAMVNLDRHKDSPYTLRLWRGGSSLDLVFFDIEVLERYRNDPRYRFRLRSFGGSIWYHDVEGPGKLSSRDECYIERFGIGNAENGQRVLCSMLYQLRGLTSAHQLAWQAHERTDECRLNPISFDAWFKGDWPSHGSLFDAVVAEIQVINKIAISAFDKPFFSEEYDEFIPKHYGVLLRPTKREYIEFAKALDVMLSENINRDFFPASVSRVRKRKVKGEEVLETLGSIGLLQTWLEQSFRPKDFDPTVEICNPLKQIRSARSSGSHKELIDSYDLEFERRQSELLQQAYHSLNGLRQILMLHPHAGEPEIPDWLNEERILVQ